MKLKHIESALSDLTHDLAFDEPNLSLEQYPTSPELASHLAFLAMSHGDIIEGTKVLDLGCGTGILGISSIVVGASHVTALDTDPTAISIAQRNYQKMEMEDMNSDDDGIEFSDDTFDVVLTNPPFGTKNNAGIDVAFLKTACRLSKNVVYSFHKTSTREYLMRKINEEWGFKGEVAAEMKFEVKATYKMHKKKSVDVEVDLIR
ncbi:hypothetical protein TL16_g06485, partial [Triparma laevis f. inornata]